MNTPITNEASILNALSAAQAAIDSMKAALVFGWENAIRDHDVVLSSLRHAEFVTGQQPEHRGVLPVFQNLMAQATELQGKHNELLIGIVPCINAAELVVQEHDIDGVRRKVLLQIAARAYNDETGVEWALSTFLSLMSGKDQKQLMDQIVETVKAM